MLHYYSWEMENIPQKQAKKFVQTLQSYFLCESRHQIPAKSCFLKWSLYQICIICTDEHKEKRGQGVKGLIIILTTSTIIKPPPTPLALWCLLSFGLHGAASETHSGNINGWDNIHTFCRLFLPNSSISQMRTQPNLLKRQYSSAGLVILKVRQPTSPIAG